MQKRTREILALVLLGVLLLVGICAMGYYILVGHNWNVAATKIDDTIGQMDGYTVVLYEGTKTPESKDTSSFVSSSAESSKNTFSSVSQSTASTESAQTNASPEVPHVTVKEVAQSYQEKGATVFVVSPTQLYRYSDPFVVAKRDKRLGFMQIGKAELRSQVREDAKALLGLSTTYVVALTNDCFAASQAADGLLTGISLIICDDNLGIFPHGEYRGNSYCVQTPFIGEVGAVVISPSGVMSCKTIDSL